MGPMITRAGWIRILVFIAVGLAILPFTPGGGSVVDLWHTRAYAAKLHSLVKDDARFQSVKLASSFGMSRVLVVTGEVASDEDKEALKKIVAQSDPPPSVKVLWFRLETASKSSGAADSKSILVAPVK